MTEMQEGHLTFRFDDGCLVGKYDDWAFYRNRFEKLCGSAAVDFVCVQGEECWLVEVKDYSHYPRSNPSDLGDEVARKARDTLAGLAAARVNANGEREKAIAQRAFGSKRWRVVLHLQQRRRPSRLHPRFDPADVQTKLRQRVRGIDPHAKVVDATAPAPLPWSVMVTA